MELVQICCPDGQHSGSWQQVHWVPLGGFAQNELGTKQADEPKVRQQVPAGYLLGSEVLQGKQLDRRRASAGPANPKMPRAPPKSAAPTNFSALRRVRAPLASPRASASKECSSMASFSPSKKYPSSSLWSISLLPFASSPRRARLVGPAVPHVTLLL